MGSLFLAALAARHAEPGSVDRDPDLRELPNAREVVEGWFFCFVTSAGWVRPFSGTGDHSPEPLGWYTRERAVCLLGAHPAPHPLCECGLHGVELLTDGLADVLRRLTEETPHLGAAGNGLALARVRFSQVLPGKRRGELPPESVADPPHTIRARRRAHLGAVIVDDADAATHAARMLPSLTFAHTESLPELVRDYVGRDEELVAEVTPRR